MITSANWLHRPLKLDVISRLSLQNITTALREQPSMIIDNARHRMEPELTTRSRFIQTSLRRRYKLANLEWRLVQQQHCSTWLSLLHLHHTNILNCSSGFSNYLTHSRYIITLHGARISWGQINSLAAAASIS